MFDGEDLHIYLMVKRRLLNMDLPLERWFFSSRKAQQLPGEFFRFQSFRKSNERFSDAMDVPLGCVMLSYCAYSPTNFI